MKKYKSSYKPKITFFQSADEIVESTPVASSSPKQFSSEKNASVSQSHLTSKESSPKYTHRSQAQKVPAKNHSGEIKSSPHIPGQSSERNINHKKPNFAFIDGQNLNKSIQNQGWSLDYKEFRKYLDEKYAVKKAYMFIGMVSTNQQLYSALQDFGYHLVFKPTIANKFGDIKGNVDAEMVLYALTQINQYNQAVIVSGDGDFYTLVQYLQSQRKLKKLLVPNEQAYSALYDTLDIDASFVDDLRNKLEYSKKKRT